MSLSLVLDGSMDDSSSSSSSSSSSDSSSTSSESFPPIFTWSSGPSRRLETANSRATLTWKIEKYSSFLEPRVSETFMATALYPKRDPTEITFRLKMIPVQQYSYESPQHTIVYLDVYDSKHHEYTLSMKCRFSVINILGNQALTQVSKTKLEPKGSSSNNAFYSLSREYILDLNSGVLKDDVLTIYCEVEFIEEDYYAPIKPQQMASTSTLLKDYGSLLESAKFSDVVLVVGRSGETKKNFRAHKNILGARSTVLAALFEPSTQASNQPKDSKDKKEKKKVSRVVIRDIKPEVFEQFIGYVYTGKVANMYRYSDELLKVAEKYQMDCLKTLCRHFIINQLNGLDTEHVIHLLDVSDRGKSAQLKSVCAEYFADHAEEMIDSEAFNTKIKNKPELVLDLFKTHVKRFKSNNHNQV